MSLEEHAEELASELGVDEDAIRQDLENLVEYSVPIDEAKRNLRRKYGDDDGSTGGVPPAIDLAELGTDSGNVTVTAMVLTVGKRPIRYRGEDHVIYEGELADETGTVSYTAWEEFDLSPGDVVRVGNAEVREWEGRPELNFGSSATVEHVDTDLDIDYDIGGDTTLDSVSPGDRGVNLEVQVIEVESKTISGRDGDTEILSGVFADESARLPFTDWEPRDGIDAGASVRVENAYIREFRGVPSVNLSEFSTVDRLDREVATGGPNELSIGDAIDAGGAYDVELVGNVIAVREGSGLIQRCPECGRVVQSGQCRTHGAVDSEDDLRVKAILDDGTGAVTAVLDRELTESVYGDDLEAARTTAREAMDQSVVADQIRDAIVGRQYRANGHLSVDDYGANLEVVSFQPTTTPPTERAQSMLADVGVDT